jgi:hypothetical protein
VSFIRLYMRVLTLLGSEARLGWILAVANLALAGAMFAEPILFGRIIDTLANSQARAAELDWNRLVLLLGAWSASRCSPSSAARSFRCTPTGCRTASIRWCAPSFSSMSCNCRSATTPAHTPAGW